MKCPNCNYEHGYNLEIMKDVKGEHGGFFSLSTQVTMQRSFPFRTEERSAYGCPCCCSIFMKEY